LEKGLSKSQILFW